MLALAAAIVAVVMALTTVPAVATPIPAPPRVPDASHALSAVHKKRCAKRHRKNRTSTFWWDISYYDGNADGWYDAMGFDLNPIDTIMDSWYSLQQPVTASVSPLVSENVVTMNLISPQDPWAQRDPWGTWAGNAANDPLY